MTSGWRGGVACLSSAVPAAHNPECLYALNDSTALLVPKTAAKNDLVRAPDGSAIIMTIEAPDSATAERKPRANVGHEGDLQVQAPL
jgi:hypothetical protein